MMKSLKSKSRGEHISDKKRYVSLKFGFPKIIGIKLDIWFSLSLCSSMINIFQNKMINLCVYHQIFHCRHPLGGWLGR